MKFDTYTYALIAAGGFLGCILMGIFMYESIYIGAFSRETRIFFGVGVIGAFTTFSSLAVQSFKISPGLAILNIGANLVFGLHGIFVGRYFVSYQREI